MAILHSCCCWKSVRHGSIACGLYTGIYYTVNAIQSAYLLHEEIRFIRNGSRNSLIDHDLTSGTSAAFSTLIFAFSASGVVSTGFLFYGIFKDIKYLLLPWIYNTTVFTIVDIFYIIHGLIVHALQWNPSVAILITIDFFLNTLNLYAILCVTSQYQEYKAGRGKAINTAYMRRSSNHQQTATTYLSSNLRKPPMYLNKNGPESPGSQIAAAPRLARPKKSVKFGDSSNKNVIMTSPLWDGPKLLASNGFDTAPLIDASLTKVHV